MSANNRFLIILVILIVFTLPQYAYSQFFRVDTSYKAEVLINNHFLKNNQCGLKIKNIDYQGEKNSLGLYLYKGENKVLPSSGIILSTGSVIESEGPNKTNISTENYTSGDDDIEAIINNESFDAATIGFDFMSFSDSISFSFVFASEEYPEYVNKGVSDAFAFFVNEKNSEEKTNLAKLPLSEIPITVDLINTERNSNYFINNSFINFAARNYTKNEFLFYSENRYLFEFDGFTRIIKTGIKLIPYKLYHFKIVIADLGDRKYDSWVLMAGNSFCSNGNIINPTNTELEEYFNYFSNDSISILRKDNTISITAPIYFDFNNSLIKKDSYSLLDQIVSVLLYSNYTIEINGFADKIGEIKYNQTLSQQRADNVKKYLVLKGVSESRIQSIGRGILDLENHDLSRKVEFILK